MPTAAAPDLSSGDPCPLVTVRDRWQAARTRCATTTQPQALSAIVLCSPLGVRLRYADRNQRPNPGELFGTPTVSYSDR